MGEEIAQWERTYPAAEAEIARLQADVKAAEAHLAQVVKTARPFLTVLNDVDDRIAALVKVDIDALRALRDAIETPEPRVGGKDAPIAASHRIGCPFLKRIGDLNLNHPSVLLQAGCR